MLHRCFHWYHKPIYAGNTTVDSVGGEEVRAADLKTRKANPDPVAAAGDHRERILKAAMSLLARGGRDALTTRAVAEAARVQPPVLYRLFRDKAGLLNAVADYGFRMYMAKKRPAVPPEDPVESLRAGWRLHIEFGLTHPELYLLMYADPQPAAEGLAAKESHGLLREHMGRAAAAGRLRVSEERAAHLFHAAACGTVMTLLGMLGEQREMSLPEAACDAALTAIVTDEPALPAPTAAWAATTLRALLFRAAGVQAAEANLFTEAERTLMMEWLDRLTRPTHSRDDAPP